MREHAKKISDILQCEINKMALTHSVQVNEGQKDDICDGMR